MAACEQCLTNFPLPNCNFCPVCGHETAGNEQKIIEEYFHRGYKYHLITCLLKNEHGINMSVRSLKRRLKSYSLSKRTGHVCEEQVRNLIRAEMEGAGCLAGYRKMWHILKLKHHLHVPRKLVQKILKELDPEASNLRRNRMLKRRQYLSHGPNQCWHIDGYDKLKPFGFPIHGAVDGFSRKVLWLEVTRSNNSPQIVAQFYLECIKQNEGCPLQTQSDCGTENGIIAGAQCYFRSDDNAPFSGTQAHVFGTSPHNQRIENWWSHFKKTCTNWWIQFFKDLVDERQLNLEDEYTNECLWFCFNGVLQHSLDEVQLYWNTHYIRPSRHETVGGVPDILYAIPEEFGAFDCRIHVSENKVQEIEANCVNADANEENIYQEYFHYLMDFHGLQYPVNHDESLQLFQVLMTYN